MDYYDSLSNLFSGKIRSMNGSNDNPTATQFMSAYRKLLHQSDILISNYSNITTQCSSNILTISSLIKGQPSQAKNITEEAINEAAEETEWNEVMELQSLEYCSPLIDSNDTGVLFVAHLLERRLLEGPIYCNFCKEVLEKNPKVNGDMCFAIGKTCLSTFQLCKLTDIALKTRINTGLNYKEKVYLSVMNHIDFDNVFPEFYDPEHDIDHKHYLIKFFIDEYINKKCAYVAKQKTLALQKRYVRNNLRKIVHRANQ